nr:retrotransposon protein, putative, Ty1-copia subclass [Tanacetum cinerariifolium]
MAARGQNHGKGKNKLAYTPKPKIPPPPKREDPVKDSICQECGETGHWKRNCPQYLAELLKKKKSAASGAGGSGIFVIELNTILNRSWIYDTSYGTHICNTTQSLRASKKLKPGALRLYMGNGQREAVEVIGVFYLCLPSGLEIVLNNCHYAPSITRGVIFVSHLYEDGFINRFVNNTIQVSRNNMVYFSAIPRDDLDSTLLWHCRLGHISKKRIEKLQHDGLLNSTDLRDFEKCVPCMSGKMAREPYTYQVERAKDLLRLIHTDDHGIIAHRTPPYTPQHNGVSERRNKTLLDMIRSMMSQTTLPKSFWDYALETAARILNMVPTKKVEKTPYEVWHGQAPKLSYLKVWVVRYLLSEILLPSLTS